jgi:hypothetical protein
MVLKLFLFLGSRIKYNLHLESTQYQNEKYFSIKSNKLISTKLVCLLGFVFPRPGIFKAGLLVGCFFNKQGCLARGEKQGGPTENKN